MENKMEQKIGYTIAAYFGNRVNYHSQYLIDPLFYIKVQLQYISKLNTRFEKIYIICTFDDTAEKVNIMNNLYLLVSLLGDNVIVIPRENLGGSYTSWHMALDIDNGYCDYMILEEDDYTIFDVNSVDYMLEYFKIHTDLFYLCTYWTDKPYPVDGVMIPNHAAISNGMLDNKLYQELKSKGLDFRLEYNIGKECIFRNQASYLEPYRLQGIKMVDFRHEHSAIFSHSPTQETEFGNPLGAKIFVPICDNYFKINNNETN